MNVGKKNLSATESYELLPHDPEVISQKLLHGQTYASCVHQEIPKHKKVGESKDSITYKHFLKAYVCSWGGLLLQ